MCNEGVKKIKLCFIIDSLEIGGANILTADLANILVENDQDVSLIALKKTNNLSLILNDNVKFIDVDLFSYKFLKRIIILYKIIKQYDIIHSTLEQSNFYSSLVAIFLPSAKLICSVHGKEGVFIEDMTLQKELKKKNLRKYVIIVKYFQKFLNYRFNKFISLSDDTSKFLVNQRGIPDRKIERIYYGYDLKKLENISLNNEANSLRERLKYSKEDFVVLYLGRITYAKGLEMLIESMHILTDKYKNLKLLIVGEGELKKDLKDLTAKFGLEKEINFIGLDYDVIKYYRISDLFVLPSMSECIPLTVEEAMFLKTTVLTSDAGGLTELVKDNFNGFVFEKGKHDSLINKFIFIMENRNKMDRIRENAKEYIQEKFNLRKNYLDILKLFIKVAGK